MKKRIIFVFTAAMLFFSPVMLSSCGDEEENEPVQNNSGKNNGTNNNQQTVKEESKYTVSYSSDFGVAPQSLTVKEGDKLTSGDLKPLDTDGYIFLGWYNGSNQVEEGFVVKQDLKLVAKWTKDGVVYANELKEFLAKKTDDSKVYDINISDLNPDMDVVVKALKDNPTIKVNLNLENCTELKDVKIMPDGGISKSKVESFLVNLVSLTLPNGVVNIVLGCDGLTSINIPNSVTTIEIYTETPPAIRNANAINPDCKIFVEKECVDAFKNAEGWKTVSIQIKTIGGNYLYANELNDFMAKQTDESKVYDVIILDLKPDMDVIVNALVDNPKVKINLDLEGCTDLTEVVIMYGEPTPIPPNTDPNPNSEPTPIPPNTDQDPNSEPTPIPPNTDPDPNSEPTPIPPDTDPNPNSEPTNLTNPVSVDNTLNMEQNTNINNLLSIKFSNVVTLIKISNCNNLKSLNIPNSVRELSTNIENPPVILNANTINHNCAIYVPASAVETYKNANGWSKYAEQIKAIIEEAPTPDPSTTPSSDSNYDPTNGEGISGDVK